MTTYPSPDAFYADRPERRDSSGVTFGDQWWDGGSSFPRWRVFWCEATHELCAVCVTPAVHHPLSGTVQVLGTAATRKEANALMNGRARLRYAELDWVRGRIAAKQT